MRVPGEAIFPEHGLIENILRSKGIVHQVKVCDERSS